jgi:RNA polymerase sigma-70 factor (ECF subfamily)
MLGEELLDEAHRHKEKLLNFFAARGVSSYEGEDLVQETFLRLWNYRETYKPTAKLSTFLFILARQVWLDAVKRTARREKRERRWGEELDVVRPAVSCARDDVRWAVSRLSPPLRDVVELAMLQDLPYAEVAEILGIPVGTVKSRMFNALRTLKEVLDEQGS